MSRLLNALAMAIAFGVFAGSLLAFWEIRVEGHLENALHGQALAIWWETTWRAVGVAAGASAVALLWRSIGSRWFGVGSVGWRSAAFGLSAFLIAALPVWFWMPLHARALFPGGREEIVAGFVVCAGLHVLAYFAAFRIAPGRAIPGLVAIGAGFAALCLLIVGGTAHGVHWFADPRLGERANLLLIVLDTVRADRLSSYGYSRPTTPELDAFAANAIRFENFYSTSSWTVPSHASLFTGLFPIRHGATQENLSLESEFTTLAEVLGNAGYQTFAASQNPLVSDTVNLVQGFESFAPLWRKWVKPDGSIRHADREVHLVNEAFEAFLETAKRDRPFFAFLNYIDAHLPSAPPEPYLSRFLRPGVGIDEALRIGRENWSHYYVGKTASELDLNVLSDFYDAELAYLSFVLDQLFEALRRDGRFDDTLIVVTSDHGEHLGDHGHLGHQFTLYNATVRVPMILKLPRNAGPGRVERKPGQLVDLFPTLLAALGVSFDASRLQGVDLLEGDARTTVFSEYYFPNQVLAMYSDAEQALIEQHLATYRRRLRAVEADGMRLIWSSDGQHELYDTVDDPGETRNLYPARPEVVALLMERLDAAVKAYGGGETAVSEGAVAPEFDEETRDALRALGYIQ